MIFLIKISDENDIAWGLGLLITRHNYQCTCFYFIQYRIFIVFWTLFFQKRKKTDSYESFLYKNSLMSHDNSILGIDLPFKIVCHKN